MDSRAHLGPLALVVEDDDGTFAICDGRDGAAIDQRHELRDAAAVASVLNARYPCGCLPPAHDTLCFELAAGFPELDPGRREEFA